MPKINPPQTTAASTGRSAADDPVALRAIVNQAEAIPPVTAETTPMATAALILVVSVARTTERTEQTNAPTTPGTSNDQKAKVDEPHPSTTPAPLQCVGTRSGTSDDVSRTSTRTPGGSHDITAARSSVGLSSRVG